MRCDHAIEVCQGPQSCHGGTPPLEGEGNLDSATTPAFVVSPICKHLVQQLRSMALAPSSSQMPSPARIPMLTAAVPRLVWLLRVASSVCGAVLAIPNELSGETMS